MTSMWFMYVVCCSDETYYTGITTNIDRRLHEHNHLSAGAKYTRSRRPVTLVYYEPHENRSSASKAEHAFKKKSRAEKSHFLGFM